MRSYWKALEKGMDKMVIPNRGKVVALMLALALVGGLLTLTLLAKPTQAQGQGAVSEQEPLEFTLDATECAGEYIDLTGTLHTVNHVTMQEDGTYHVISNFNFQNVKGVGRNPETFEPTGNEYVFSAGPGTAVENYTTSGQLITSIVDLNLIIGKGQLVNQVAHSQIHYVIDDDGTLKVENVHIDFKCQ
jgi:hypothetical protein